jgi:hypothetical protein
LVPRSEQGAAPTGGIDTPAEAPLRESIAMAQRFEGPNSRAHRSRLDRHRTHNDRPVRRIADGNRDASEFFA